MSTIRLSCDESAIKLSIILSLRMKPNQPYAAITQVFIVNCRRNNNIAKCTNSIICDFTHKPFFCLSPRSVLCYAFERGSADCRSAKTIFHIANICTAFHLYACACVASSPSSVQKRASTVNIGMVFLQCDCEYVVEGLLSGRTRGHIYHTCKVTLQCGFEYDVASSTDTGMLSHSMCISTCDQYYLGTHT